MKDLFAKCGANCGRCPAFRANAKTAEDRQRCSDGWHKYLGVRLSVQRCYCDGCQTPDDQNPVLVYGKYGCKIRRCAVFNGVETCAHCSAYPCEDVRTQFSFDSESRERIAARLGTLVPEEEYSTFIEPYELHRHLDEIHASLAPEDIVEMTQVSVKPRTVDLPDDLPFSREETAAFEALHRLLAAVGTVSGVSHARQEALKERRRLLLKMLWAFGLLGERKEEGGSHLVIDSETYLAQKIQSNYSKVKDYFKALGEYRVRCEHVPLTEEGWLTPKGALRKEGWFIKMSFDDEAGGESALEALQSYTARLHEKYGKRAFRYFSTADMRVLSKD
jgi:hypothetical protein